MDHDITTAPGAAAAAGAPTPPGPRSARGRIPGQAGAASGGGAGSEDVRSKDALSDDARDPDARDSYEARDPADSPGPAGSPRRAESPGPSGMVGTVRLASPGSVIATIPFLFGFHPENSLVVLGVSHSAEGGSFIRHGVRIDLDQVRGQERGTALELAGRLRDQDADIAILVAYGPRAATGAKARPDHCRKLMAAFRAQLEAAADEERVTVVDALYTANGRWWSYMCRNNRCCPAAGTVVPAEAPAALAGAFTTRGHTVYASREALDATLDPYPPETLARTAAAAEQLDPAWYDTDAGLAEARRLMDVLLDRCGADAEDPTPRASRADGPRAGRRGLSGSATAALATRSGAYEPGAYEPGADVAATDRSVSEAADGSVPTGPAASRRPRRSDPDDRSASSSPAADQSAPSVTGATPHTSSAVIPAARSSRSVGARVAAAAGSSGGVPLGALAEPPGSLLAPPVVTDAEAAELLIALLNWRVRDYLACAAATVDSAGRLLRLGAELARRAPHPELRLAPYALAAWAAWAIGRPAIAQCAVDRALAIDPEYKFASLIRAGLHHAIDGEGVRDSAASTRRDLFGEAAVDDSAGVDNTPGLDNARGSDPEVAPAPVPTPRSTETTPTESDLEIP